MEFCINKETKERIFAFDIKNEYGIKDFLLEKKLRIMSTNELLICPECGTPVILKAGEIKIPHFSHKIKTKECFYSTYTYNENRVKALKILYDKLKKYKEIKILEISKKFKTFGVIDILIEGKDFFKNRRYAIMIKNTMEDINKWEKLHIELLKEEITPIYFNYGTTEEIKSFQSKISKSFFYRNLMNLTTNHGIRLIDTEKQEFYTIATTFYLDKSNRLKNYENILYKEDYEEFFKFIFNSKGANKYKFLDDIKQDYTLELLKYKEKLEPFLMININQEIFLGMNIEDNNISGEEDYKSLEIKYIPLNYFMFTSINNYSYMYFYIEEKSFYDECLSDFYSLEKEEEIKEFFEYPAFNISKIIPIKEAGIFENDIEEFIKNYGEVKNNIFKYNYMSEDCEKDFKLLKLKNLNDPFEINKFIKDKEIMEKINVFLNDYYKFRNFFESNFLKEVKDFFRWQFSNFYEVVIYKDDIKRIVNFLEDKIFDCNKDSEIIELEKLYKIFKGLKIDDFSKEEVKLLFSKKEIEEYKLIKLFFDIFKKEGIPFRYNETNFDAYPRVIFPFFRNKEFDLNILNTYYKLIKKETLEEKQLKIFNNSLERYFKNKDFKLFLRNIEQIKKEYLEKFLIKNLNNILENNLNELILFMVKNIDLNKSIGKTCENLDYFLNSEPRYIRYESFMEKILKEKNIVLFESILGTKYEDMISLQDIASIIYYNSKLEVESKILKKNILNKKINLNKQNETGTSLFYYLCSFNIDSEFINFCLKNGADLYLKNKKRKTPYMILEKKQLPNLKLPNKKN